jgi:hypothetical protein
MTRAHDTLGAGTIPVTPHEDQLVPTLPRNPATLRTETSLRSRTGVADPETTGWPRKLNAGVPSSGDRVLTG